MPQIGVKWFAAAAALFFLVFVASVLFCNEQEEIHKKLIRGLSMALLLSYLFLLIIMLVINRESFENGHILPPFYSYRRMLSNTNTGKEWRFLALFNVMLFVPFGFFLGFAQITSMWKSEEIKNKRTVKTVVLSSALSGFLASLLIEVLQFALKRGVFEFDDLLHNTMGVIVGTSLFFVINKTIMVLSERKIH